MPNKGKYLGLLSGLILSTSAFATDIQDTNQFMIRMAGDGPADLAAAVERAGGRLVHNMGEIGYASAISEHPNFARRLAKQNGIAAVDRDYKIQWLSDNIELDAMDAGAFSPVSIGEQGLGIDPTLAAWGSCQWNNEQIDVAGAWAKGHTGSGVKVAVIDTGVDPFHQDMVGQIDAASTSFISEGHPGCDSVSEAVWGVKDSETIYDFRFHGAFVAGEIAAHGLVTAGVAPDATIVGIKGLNCVGSGSFGDLAGAIVYAANVPGVEVINMSLGAYIPSRKGLAPLISAMNRAVNYANSKGVLVVSAAGNDGADLQHDGNAISLPAESGAGLATWAGGIEGNLASYSNHGANKVKLGAGGGSYDLPSTQIPLPGCPLPAGSQFGIAAPCSTTSLFFGCSTGTFYLFGGTGTSFSAPMVAGVAALLDGKHGGAMGAGDLKDALKASADDIGAPGTDNEFGQGRVNASSAVDH